MKNLEEFRQSLSADKPGENLSIHLQALWYDAKGDWQQAHQQVDHLSDEASAWIHAYLHRKEGDIWNADYWYRNAKRKRPQISLSQEWEELVLEFLSK